MAIGKRENACVGGLANSIDVYFQASVHVDNVIKDVKREGECGK